MVSQRTGILVSADDGIAIVMPAKAVLGCAFGLH